MQIFKVGQRRRGIPQREPALSAQSRKYVVVNRDMQVAVHFGQVGQDIRSLIGCLLSCGAELRQLKPRATLAWVEDEWATVPKANTLTPSSRHAISICMRYTSAFDTPVLIMLGWLDKTSTPLGGTLVTRPTSTVLKHHRFSKVEARVDVVQ